MENISRRRALALLPAAAAVATPAAALTIETADDRARRLRAELADTLNDAFGGKFGAEVFPSRDIPHDVGGKFFSIATHCDAWRLRDNALRLVEHVREMPPLERARHHAQQLQLALFEARPGVWIKSFIHDEPSGEIAAVFVNIEKRRAR